MEGKNGIPSVSRHRRTPAYNFRQLSVVGEGKEMGRVGGVVVLDVSLHGMHVECKAPARSPDFEGTGRVAGGPPPPSSPSPSRR